MVSPYKISTENGACKSCCAGCTGRVIAFAAVDHLCWTQEVAYLSAQQNAELSTANAEQRELWVLGSVSERCRHELKKAGWQVYEGVQTEIAED